MELEEAKQILLRQMHQEIEHDTPGCYLFRQAVYTLCAAYPVSQAYEKLCQDLCALLAEHNMPCAGD